MRIPRGPNGQPYTQNYAPVVPTSNMRVQKPGVTSKSGIIQQNQAQNQGTGTGQSTSGAPTGSGTPNGPAPYNPNDPSQNDNAANQAIYELLSQGPRDTSADEARVANQLQANMGQGQADLNARLGAGGFGTSGALGAASADMRQKATLAAQQQDLGIEQNARDQWLNQVMAGLEGEFKDRGMDMSQAQYDNYLQTLLALQGGGGGNNGAGASTSNDYLPGNNQDPNTLQGGNALTDIWSGLGSLVSGHGYNPNADPTTGAGGTYGTNSGGDQTFTTTDGTVYVLRNGQWVKQ